MSDSCCIYGVLREAYATFGSNLRGWRYNFVGIVYADQLILFRTFDGSIVNYIASDQTLEQLIGHSGFSSIYCRKFNLEQLWLDRQISEDTLKNRIVSAVIASLEYSVDFRQLIRSYLFDLPVENGWYRINSILASICKLDLGSNNPETWNSICSDYYLQDEKAIDIRLSDSADISFSLSLQNRISAEVSELYFKLSSAFFSIIQTDSSALSAIKSLSFSMEFSDFITAVRSRSLPVDQELELIRNLSTSLFSSTVPSTFRSAVQDCMKKLEKLISILKQEKCLALWLIYDIYAKLHSTFDLSPSGKLISSDKISIDQVCIQNTPRSLHVRLNEKQTLDLSNLEVELPDLSTEQTLTVLKYLEKLAQSTTSWDHLIELCIAKLARDN